MLTGAAGSVRAGALAVIPLGGKASLGFATQLRAGLEKALKPQARLVDAKPGAPGAALEAVATAAGAVGATHVLLVSVDEPRKRGKGKTPPVGVTLKLVGVAQRNELLLRQLPLDSQRRLTAKAYGALITDLRTLLADAAPSAAPAADPTPAPEARAPSVASAQPSANVAPEPSEVGRPLVAAPPAAVAPSPAPRADNPAPGPGVGSAPRGPMAVLAPSPGPSVTMLAPPPSEEPGPGWRQVVDVLAGGGYLYRSAQITGTTVGSSTARSAPSYKGPVPGGELRVELYPLALRQRRSWYEGFGLYLEGQYQRIETVVDSATGESVISNFVGARGGLALRLALGSASTAPDLTLAAGAAIRSLPIAAGPFPGARYSTLDATLRLRFPIGTHLAIIGSGTYSPWMSPTGGLDELGDHTRGRPSAFAGEAGLCTFWAPVQLLVVGRFEQLDARYRGTTSLPGTTVQWTGAALRDRTYGGLLLAGISL